MPAEHDNADQNAGQRAAGALEPGASPANRGFWMRTGMPRWIPRLLLLIFVTYAVGSWALVQVGHLGFFIRILVYSLFVSFALEPAVDWLEEHGWRRGLGTGLAMLITLVAGVAIVVRLVPLVVCALERGLVPFLVLLAFVAVYQQFENYVLSPRISAHTMQLHPAVAFGAAIVGGSLFGIMGAFLAVPVAAIIQAVVSTYVNRYELIDSDLLRDHDPDTPD